MNEELAVLGRFLQETVNRSVNGYLLLRHGRRRGVIRWRATIRVGPGTQTTATGETLIQAFEQLLNVLEKA
jgi:hypothetical protein